MNYIVRISPNAVCQVDEGGGGFDGQAAGAVGDDANNDDDDDAGGVDFGLLMADDASQSQFVTSQAMDEMGDCDGTVLAGDNLLAVPRKVIHQFVNCQAVYNSCKYWKCPGI